MPPPRDMSLVDFLSRQGGKGAPQARAVQPGLGQGVLHGVSPVLGPATPQIQVVNPLGSLYPHVAPIQSFRPFTFYKSNLPDERMYDPGLSSTRPFTFNVAVYRVPENMALMVLGYEFGASRVGGVDPSDIVPLESGRMKHSWIWDLNVSGDRVSRDVSYGIIPTPIVQNGAGTGLPQSLEANVFAGTDARLTQNASGAGLSGLPFDGRAYGPEDAPFTLIAQQGQYVAIRCSINRPLSVPLAEITGRFDGYLFPITELARYQKAIEPTL